MIKKMMAMLVAISCAIGAWADVSGHLSGTDFSTHPVGTFETQHDDAGNPIDVDHHTYWYNGDTSDFEGTIVLGTNETDHVLDFESNITNPLYRTISTCDGVASPASFTTTPIGSGLFIDTRVQFTPYLVNENHPAPTKVTEDDKLIVWVRETEVDGGANITNLIVTAGYLAGNGSVSVSNYLVNLPDATVSALCAGQHRLTIKSYQNITTYSGAYVMGFVVYIDEKAVEYAGNAFADNCIFFPLATTPGQYYTQDGSNNKLFPCLMQYTMSGSIDDYSKLSGVGYAGMGKIGDVFFDNYSTDFPEFARDDRVFEVVVGDGVEYYYYNGTRYYVSSNFTIDATAASVTISNVHYLAGWKHKKGTWYNGSTIVSNEYDEVTGNDYGTFILANGERLNLVGFQANYLVGDTEYQTLYGNMTENGAIIDALNGGGTFKLTKDTVISEGDFKNITIGVGASLTIDLNGRILRGGANNTTTYTIVNNGGNLTVLDSSVAQTGALLGSIYTDTTLGEVSNYKSIYLGAESGATVINAGTNETIKVDIDPGEGGSLTLNGGVFMDEDMTDPGEDTFYLNGNIASGLTVVEWYEDPVSEYYYATVGIAGGITYPVTFSTNSVTVAEYTTNITAGATLPNAAIPAFTGGAWDVDPTSAVINAATNFNYTIAVQLSYFPQSTIEEQWADRDGTAAKPFVIRNLADLYGLQDDISKGYNIDRCFEQVADIDMDGEPAWAGIGAFEVTSAGAGAFEGTYDGGNHVITNVTFDQHEYHGLFASAVGAVIKNLTVDVDGFAATSSFGGAAIAGVAENCYLTNLVATGTIIGQSNTPCTHSAAGIAVRMEGTVAYACTNRCEIWSGKGKLGGIAAIGQPYNSVTGRDYLTLCSNEGDLHNTKGTLSDTEGVGGLFGYLGYHNNGQKQHITFTDCRSIGTVDSAASNNTGSFVGNTSDLNVEAIVLSGTNVTLDGMRVIYTENAPGGVTYGKSIGGGLVELCTQAAFETNNTYSTLYSGLTPTFEFSAPGTIAFNTNLYAVTAFAITKTGDLELTDSESSGIVTFTASLPGPTDPWEPASEDPADVAVKVDEVFGSESEVAAHVTTYAEYEALVTYIQSTTGAPATPGNLTTDQKTWMWKSYILGANPLFDEEPAVQITSLTAGATAGLWDFTVKVTEGESTDAYNVAADKVGALVKISSSLTPGTWVAPTAGNISAVKLLGGNLIQVEVNFGDGTSGFMKVSE